MASVILSLLSPINQIIRYQLWSCPPSTMNAIHSSVKHILNSFLLWGNWPKRCVLPNGFAISYNIARRWSKLDQSSIFWTQPQYNHPCCSRWWRLEPFAPWLSRIMRFLHGWPGLLISQINLKIYHKCWANFVLDIYLPFPWADQDLATTLCDPSEQQKVRVSVKMVRRGLLQVATSTHRAKPKSEVIAFFVVENLRLCILINPTSFGPFLQGQWQ